MIRKRIKKRRNPSEQEELRERRLTGCNKLKLYLSKVVKSGNPNDLVDSIILYEQGETCYDCYNEQLGETPKKYWECICESCHECGFRRNLCYLSIDYVGDNKEDYTEDQRERVREAGYELILRILTEDIYNDGRKYNIVPDIKYKNLNELKKDFLNNVLQKDNIDLSMAFLSNANLSNANLSDANLADANLSDSNLSKANLSNANLFGTDLTGVVLTDANLSNTNLSKTNLSRANLSGANLSGANLMRSDLIRTDLSGTNLSGANLSEADFTNAKITNSTNFTDAYCIDQAIGLIIPNPRKKSPIKKRVK